MGVCGSKSDIEHVEDSPQVRREKKNSGPTRADGNKTPKKTPDPAAPNIVVTETSKSDASPVVVKPKAVVPSLSLESSPGLQATKDPSPKAATNDGQAIKVLLLGAGESGKSTILQQLKVLHQNGFTRQELIEYKPLIYDNVLEIGVDVIRARRKFKITLEPSSGLTELQLDGYLHDYYRMSGNSDKDENSDAASGINLVTASKMRNLQDGNKDIIESSQDEFHKKAPAGANAGNSPGNNSNINTNNSSKFKSIPAENGSILRKLWALPSTKNLLQGSNSSKFYIMDSAYYFMENIDRIMAPNYIPSTQDVIRSRQKTSGIFDTVIDMGDDLKMHVYDVGGQRSERKKWIHCFDNVTLVIFCLSLPEYDQFLLEDKTQNRFQESLVLFDNIINSRWFARTSVVLFLNKIDLFAEKVQRVPLANYFHDYTGGNDVNKAAKYILWRFVQLNRANLHIYPHVTQATDTSNIKLVFAAIKETILENSLKDTGVLY